MAAVTSNKNALYLSTYVYDYLSYLHPFPYRKLLWQESGHLVLIKKTMDVYNEIPASFSQFVPLVFVDVYKKQPTCILQRRWRGCSSNQRLTNKLKSEVTVDIYC